MGKINKSGKMTGRIGNMVYRDINGVTYTSALPSKMKNPQSTKQMMQRVKKQNIVNLYGCMKSALKDNFQGKTGHQSDYTMFVSNNLYEEPVYLCKDEAYGGKTVVVAPYVVSSGKLHSVEYHLDGDWLVSNIRIGSLQISEELTVSLFTKYIIVPKGEWRDEDILEFISCRQLTKEDSDGKTVADYVKCYCANITLDEEDYSPLVSNLSGIELKVNDEGYLCMKADVEGGFAIVHRRKITKDIAVSTQSLVVRNSVLEYYQSSEQCDKAISSYVKKLSQSSILFQEE